MAFDEGFNFRSTIAYRSDDPTDTQGVECGAGFAIDYYETNRNGVHFGWVNLATSIDGRNRDTGNDPRLGGQANGGGVLDGAPYKFRVNLPNSGTFRIWLAIGDDGYARANLAWRILDNVTAKQTITGASTSASHHFLDASNTERTSQSDWSTNQASADYSFASTTFFLEIGDGVNNGYIAHLRILDVTPAADVAQRNPRVQGMSQSVSRGSMFRDRNGLLVPQWV